MSRHRRNNVGVMDAFPDQQIFVNHLHQFVRCRLGLVEEYEPLPEHFNVFEGISRLQSETVDILRTRCHHQVLPNDLPADAEMEPTSMV